MVSYLKLPTPKINYCQETINSFPILCREVPCNVRTYCLFCTEVYCVVENLAGLIQKVEGCAERVMCGISKHGWQIGNASSVGSLGSVGRVGSVGSRRNNCSCIFLCNCASRPNFLVLKAEKLALLAFLKCQNF